MIDTVLIIVFMIIVMLLILKVSLDIREKYTSYTSYLDHKSKCFDCEIDIRRRCGVEYAWKAQPAKSFDSEYDLVTRYNDPAAGYGAKTLKYY